MKKLILLFVFCFSFSTSFAQQIMWEHTVSGPMPKLFLGAVDKDQDSAVVIGGGNFEFNSGPFKTILVKYNKNGNQIWQKFGRNLRSGELDITTYNGGYIFLGQFKKPYNPALPADVSDFGLYWLNNNGDTIQTNLYGSPTYVDFTTRILPVNNDIYLLGYSSKEKQGQPGASLDYSLVKLSNNGTTYQWFKTYGTNDTQISSDIILNQRGNLVISGKSDDLTINNSYYHPYLVEINTNGDTIRTKRLILFNLNADEHSQRMVHNIAETADGNYILSGEIFPGGTPREFFIVKLNQNFNVIWSYKTVPNGPDLRFNKVQELADGSFVVLLSGHTAVAGDYHILKLNSAGQYISRTAYNSPITGPVWMYDWTFLGDGSVVVVGENSVSNQGYVARLRNVGIPAVISSLPEKQNKQIKLGQSYPNPAALAATIPYHLSPNVKEASLKITEIATGRIMQQVLLTPTKNQINLNLKVFKLGVYSYTLLEDGLPTATKKMVVVK